jgi:hypothetical protein
MMKRNQVKMTTTKVLQEVQRELGVRAGVYPKWIQQKKLAEITAAERYLAFLEVKEILELMQQKEISLDEIKALLDSIVLKPKPQQGRMQFGNSSPKNPI